MLILLTFMYIFGFKLYGLIDSTILVGGILAVFFIINEGYRKKVFLKLVDKYLKTGVCCALVLTIVALVVVLVNQTYDLTYIETLIHLYIVIAIGILLIAYFDYKGKISEMLNTVIICFIIQTLLQWIFFLLPDVSKLFNIFRTESMILNNIKYSGYRGLAISSSGFFGLSSAYAVASVLYFTKGNTLFKNILVKYGMFLFMFSGVFFAGRTGFVALPFIFVIELIKVIKNRKSIFCMSNKKNLVLFVIFTIVFIVAIVITMQIPKFSSMYHYAFELFRNIFSGKGFTTTSTDGLLAMYDVDMSVKTFFVGDGIYTVNQNGVESYYMNTDVGYLRKLLYFGIIGFAISLAFQLCIFGKVENKKEFVLIMCLLLVLELKGEIIGMSILVNSIIMLYSAQSREKRKEKEYARVNSFNDNI